MGDRHPAYCHPCRADCQALVMARRKREPKFTYHRPDGTVDVADRAICVPCGCASGDGRPPAVGECPCRCHDTPRLWWSMRPWTAEP
jgi:hypothetical protein